MTARIVEDNADQAMKRSIGRQARAAQRALERAQLMPAPPRYLYVDGNAYMLATHAAEQMERVMIGVLAGHSDQEIANSFSIVLEQEPA